MAAEADHREEKERLDFLVRERDDLMEARKSLDETIRKINHIARERFRETFERIRDNFGVTFTNFFEGGACDLTIEEGEDPLEANILITARPPGKNVRSINLLSSGERALTAISLLFAIYLVKPSPFCILDEVDATLDDANIDRFLRVIREFARSTQFIIVTHNKKTMAAADNLYGITMEEPGLSTLVSVRLSRVGATEVSGEPELADESIVPAHG
jgi:chromosome segregation protein